MAKRHGALQRTREGALTMFTIHFHIQSSSSDRPVAVVTACCCARTSARDKCTGQAHAATGCTLTTPDK